MEDHTWLEESIHSTNLRLAKIEAQGVSHFTEWKEHVHTAVGQVKAANISVKALQQELIALTNSSTKHDDWLGIIFKSFDTFQSSLQKSMKTVTKRIDNIEDYNLGGTATVTGIPDHLILDRRIEDLDMYHIDDHLRID